MGFANQALEGGSVADGSGSNIEPQWMGPGPGSISIYLGSEWNLYLTENLHVVIKSDIKLKTK